MTEEHQLQSSSSCFYLRKEAADLIIGCKKSFPASQKMSVSLWFFRRIGFDFCVGRHYAVQPKLRAGGISVEEKVPSQVTALLQEWRNGDNKALDALLPLVYKELRRLAHFQLRNERPDHTLQSAALVHEAYLRLTGVSPPRWESRAHFFAIAGQLMRQILVDYARRRGAAKRGGSVCKLSVEEAVMVPRGKDVDVIALDDALKALSKIDERQSRVVELRFFAGLSLEEISKALDVAPATVQRDWTAARAWLYREISKTGRHEHR